jgi:hypothetical protein
VASGARRGEDLMAKVAQKVTLSPSRDIPFDKLVLSQSNVRRVKAGVSIDALAEDIARRTAQQLVVYHRRPGGQSQFSALLEMKDLNKVIKVQVPMALTLVLIHIALMYFWAF